VAADVAGHRTCVPTAVAIERVACGIHTPGGLQPQLPVRYRPAAILHRAPEVAPLDGVVLALGLALYGVLFAGDHLATALGTLSFGACSKFINVAGNAGYDIRPTTNLVEELEDADAVVVTSQSRCRRQASGMATPSLHGRSDRPDRRRRPGRDAAAGDAHLVTGISEQRQHSRPRESRPDHRRYPAERR
jgi:hypothetical protein